MPLPPYYLEVVMASGMASLSTMVMNSRGGLQVLFVSFTKGPGGFPYFIDKVSEIRFNKVKQRQLNKFNLLTIRKEGNITRSITNLNYHNHNLNSQTNSQVTPIPQASPPSGEDNRSSQAGPPMRKLAFPRPPHRPTVRLGKEALLPRLALVLPLPGKTAVFPGYHLLPLPG